MGDAGRRFRGVLERSNELGWTVMPVPFEPGAVWPAMVRLRVCGMVEGPRGRASFRSSLFPYATGSSGETRFFLLVTRVAQAACGVAAGAVAEVWLEPDMEPRPAELPEELDALLDEAEGLREWYEGLSESMRREIGKWVCGVKSAEARLGRAEQMAERLLNTMEAERELPPALERAFRMRPRAREGWARMTAVQRRNELMALFSYQSPKAQARRVEKMLAGAEKRAEQGTGR